MNGAAGAIAGRSSICKMRDLTHRRIFEMMDSIGSVLAYLSRS